MVTATDCWSESVLGRSSTVACACEPMVSAAATAVNNVLRCMAFLLVYGRDHFSHAYKRRSCRNGLTPQHQGHRHQHQHATREHRRGDGLIEKQPAPQHAEYWNDKPHRKRARRAD